MINKEYKQTIDNYVEHKYHPGHFIYSILINDLTETLSRADDIAKANFLEILTYCYKKIPRECWGSREKVEQWLQKL